MIKFEFSFILILFLLGSSVNSQTDSVYVLPKLLIDQRLDKKTVTFDFENNSYNKFFINDSFLTANTDIYNYRVKINDIKKISIRNGTKFWKIAAAGAVFGFVVGFFAGGYFTPGDGPREFRIQGAFPVALILSIPFGLLGGLLGLLSPSYYEYDLYKIPAKERASYLKNVLKKNRVKIE